MVEIARFRTDEATGTFLSELRELLTKAFGSNFSNDDWEHGLDGIHIALRDFGLLVAHAAIVPRQLYIGEDIFSGGYVENVATLPDRQHQGLASLAIMEVNSTIVKRFEVGALSSSSKDFYRRFGWEDWRAPLTF